MKLKLKKQQFQIDAVNSTAELFKGQAGAPSVFSVNALNITELKYDVAELLGYGNVLSLDRPRIQANMNAVQEQNFLPLSDSQRFAEAEQEFFLPDITAQIATTCKMPRKEVGEILLASNRSADFVNNPQAFSEAVTAIINAAKIEVMMEDGIKYTRLEGQEYTWHQVFNFADEKETFAFLDHYAVAVENSVYDHVVYDSKTVEKPFAESLNRDYDVKLFFKIPTRFKISTPIGNYSSDWAVYYETPDGEKKLYFIIETKGTTDSQGLKGYENLKIRWGFDHFKAIDSGIAFQLAKKWKAADKG